LRFCLAANIDILRDAAIRLSIQIANQFIDRGNVISAGSPAPIFPLDDVSQFQQIFRRRRIVIRPLFFARKLGLKTPDTAKFCRTDLSFLPLSIFA